MSEAKKGKERKKLRTLRFLQGWGALFLSLLVFLV